jgi:hypothetical protein
MSPPRSSAAFDKFNEIAIVRIALRDNDPVIWRQIEMPTSITLGPPSEARPRQSGQAAWLGGRRRCCRAAFSGRGGNAYRPALVSRPVGKRML